MSRDQRYQRLLNSKRWKMIRAEYLRQHPLCERCYREGVEQTGHPYITAAVDVHHKTPVEQGKTEQEMEYLAYNVGGNNLEALCIPCHIKTHQEMHSFDRENVQANKQRKRDMFMQRNDPNYLPPPERPALPAHSGSEYVEYEEITDDCKPTTYIQPISK